MSTYFIFGNYTPEGVNQITTKRTEDVSSVVKQCGGELREIYALLGNNDLCFICEFNSVEDAAKASLGITKRTGIGCTTCPAISVSDFDQIASQA